MMRTCRKCGTDFESSQPNRLFCSAECRQTLPAMEEFFCPQCREVRLVKRRKGRVTCSRLCAGRRLAEAGAKARASKPQGGAPAPQETAHRHHWIIDPPRGPMSTGRCACGEVRQFDNVGEEEKRTPRDWNAIKSGL